MRLAADTVIAGLNGAAIGVIIGYFVHTAYHSGDEALFELARFVRELERECNEAFPGDLGGIEIGGVLYRVRTAAKGR